MRGFGYLLVAVGFLVGSYFTVQQTDGVPWGGYLAALVAGAVGVVLVRRAIHGEARQADRIATNLDAIAANLELAVERARALDRDKGDIDVYELRHHIDREFPEPLDAFVQARESISHRFGLHAYAEVMNPFAAGERHLNRVWSASTDGYVDEAHAYVSRAAEELENALRVFRSHHKAD